MGQAYVAVSEIVVPEEGIEALKEAFRTRLGAVDSWKGFLGLEVLQGRRRSTEFLMISRWESRGDFLAYMRSADHLASHQRIPTGAHRARGVGFRDFIEVAN